MSRYKYTKLRNLGPVHGFLIHTPDDRKLKDVNPQFIVQELNRKADRIKRLEEENNELRAEEARLLNTNGELERRIKRLIDAGDAMFPWSERVGQEFWIKAKETKL